MKLTAIAAGVVSAWMVLVTGWIAWDVHAARRAAEGGREAASAARDGVDALKPAAQRIICPAAVSHQEHDVVLGFPAPCPDPADGQCVTYEGKTMPMGVAESRCKAGKL